MKKILFGLIILFSISSYSQKEKSTATIDDDGNLIGIAIKDDFLVEPFSEWFSYNYDDYTLNDSIVKKLKPFLKKVTIKAFMGTWCSDSQEQTPIFYKVFDAAGFNYKNLELIGVDENKKTPDNLQKGLKIKRVPTFIFYMEGQEIGRFVEYPRESVEIDMLKIISGEPYKHSYDNE